MFHRVLLAFYLRDKESSNRGRGRGGGMGRWQRQSRDGFSVEQMSFLWSQSSHTHVWLGLCVGTSPQLWTAVLLAQKPEWTPGSRPSISGPARPPWEDGAEDRAGPGSSCCSAEPVSKGPSLSLSWRHFHLSPSHHRRRRNKQNHRDARCKSFPHTAQLPHPQPTTAPSRGWPRRAVSP